MQSFHKRLRDARQSRGFSQEELAERVGVIPGTLSRWERGLTLPMPIHQQRLCKILGTSPQQLGLISEDDQLVARITIRGVSGISSIRDASRCLHDWHRV